MASPRVSLKLATSLDGRIATRSGKSNWITGEAARDQVHRLRGEHDAVMIGVGTALADDPSLTVRHDGFKGKQPARVVLDSRLHLRPHSELAQTARQTRLIVIATHAAPGINRSVLSDLGADVILVDDEDGRVSIPAALSALGKAGIDTVFAEGGGQIAASLIAAEAVDTLHWFRAPILLGSEGVPAIGALAVEAPGDAPRFTLEQSQTLGADVWERYLPA